MTVGDPSLVRGLQDSDAACVVHAENRVEPVILGLDHLRSGRGARGGEDLGPRRQLVGGLGDTAPHTGGDIVENMIGGDNDRHR